MSDQPVAWAYETCLHRLNKEPKWEPRVSTWKPADSDAVRNVFPLYTRPTPPSEVTDGMVEKVARAICFEAGHMGDTKAVEAQRVDRDWQDYIPEARAAIKVTHNAAHPTADAGLVTQVKRVVSHIERYEGTDRYTIAQWQLDILDQIAALNNGGRDA